jgi:hypothetical protein
MNVRRIVGVLLAFALGVNSGCYAFVPAGGGVAPVVGSTVRLSLTPEGMTELARFLGPRVAVVEGTLTAQSSDGAMVIGVEMVQTSDGVRQPWSGEGVVTVPKMYVVDVGVRTLNRRQTTIGTIALVASVVAIALLALAVGGAHGNAAPGGGTPAAR